MKKIEAKIVADSTNGHGHRITSFILTYPRFIHGELMTHRMFSRNSASSRAIPFNKMIEMAESDPFIPIAWQSKHTGMQGHEYLDGDSEQKLLINKWLEARDLAVQQAKLLDNSNVTKQLCNRLLEPFMWHTVLVTATEFDNFFELRCPKYQTPVSRSVEPQKSWKDLTEVHSNPENLERLEANKNNWIFKMQHSLSAAEIHIQALAEAMWDEYNKSKPKQLNPGEWHIPKFV
jgi:thymidylate synthase ThyX